MGQAITAEKFVGDWKSSTLNEKQGAQTHFRELCRMLAVPEPSATSRAEGYCFEEFVDKVGGGQGYADAWKRGCFAWEYKSPGGDLKAALKQLKLYASDLENPPLLIVSDMRRIEIHTNWTSQVQESHILELEDLKDVRLRQKLLWAFSEDSVHELKPQRSANATTEEVAKKFVALAQNLRERGHDPEKVAHFVNRMVFCMFAEDVDLLPKKMFERMLEASLKNPDEFVANAEQLFTAMAKKHGRVGYDAIDWFNGGLFEDGAALPLTRDDIRIALDAAKQNWSEINPSIMGTLFERGLDPGKRSQLGAHYTDAEKIMMIVRPVIIEPLLREWQTAREEIEAKLEQAKSAKSASAKTKASREAEAMRIAFIERLKNFRVLDPACGSGNFLYLALKSLKDIEARVNIEAESLGLSPAFPSVGPECVKGIEINPFAAELARVSVWIGEIQWMREKGFGVSKNPILKSLETIECRDALLNADGTEAEWPEADVIIGNPPFLGRTFLRESLGDVEIKRLFDAFEDIVPAESDLVCYWVTKAWQICEVEDKLRVGLVTTNSIRGGANRRALDPIAVQSAIFQAWSDEPWVVDGANVRVSIVCFGQSENRHLLDGIEVDAINSDLTSAHFDTTTSKPLMANVGLSFQGPVLVGEFDVSRAIAEKWLSAPKNPNNRANSDVLRPIRNGKDINSRPRDFWVINFGALEEKEAALFQGPFEHVVRHVKEFRAKSNDRQRRENWWRLGRSGQSFFDTSRNLTRFIATSQVSKHRFFVWLPAQVQPHQTVIAIARDDDTTFGILHSKFHELWSLRMGTWWRWQRSPLHADDLLRNLPLPRRADTQYSGGAVRRRSSGA